MFVLISISRLCAYFSPRHFDLVGSSGSASNVRQEIRSQTTRRGSKKSHPFPPSVSVFTLLPISLNPFSQVESFWSLHTHLSPPSALLPTTDYLLFHAGVRRPVWEDPLNHAGGKWIIRLRKGVADRVWEDLVCGVVGDMFDECGRGRLNDGNGAEDDDGEEWPEICGCTISVRQSEDIVAVWNRVDADMKVREKIRWVQHRHLSVGNGFTTIDRDTIRLVLNLPASTIMEYKSNNGTCFFLVADTFVRLTLCARCRLDAGQVLISQLCH